MRSKGDEIYSLPVNKVVNDQSSEVKVIDNKPSLEINNIIEDHEI